MGYVTFGVRRLALAATIAFAGCTGAAPHRLMSFDEFRRAGLRAPYAIRIETARGALLFYGVGHSSDPADPLFAELEQLWHGFSPTLAFNEGGNPPVMGSREEAIRSIGEAGWVRFVAARDSVPAQSLEPGQRAEIAALLPTHTAEQLKVFYALRQIPAFRSRGATQPLTEHLAGILRTLSRAAGLEGPPGTVPELLASCTRLLPALADCLAITDEWFDPTLPEPPGFTNELSRASGVVRDRHMIEILSDAVRRGERVFAVAGFGHVVMQERALRAVLKQRAASRAGRTGSSQPPGGWTR